jgi:hypothetical protein
MKAAAYFMLITSAAHAATVDAAPHQQGAVSIRTYNYAAVAGDQMSEAQSEAAHIFKGAGIWLEWIECRVPGSGAGVACTEPLLVGRDFMLRLVDRAPVAGERVVALGESMLDREQRGGVLMTIDLFPVRAVAEKTATAVSTLLGRAIAHEIGHLLLGSAEHPRLGLMRALWSQEELRGLKPAHWGFSSREAAQMRETLRQLTRTAD